MNIRDGFQFPLHSALQAILRQNRNINYQLVFPPKTLFFQIQILLAGNIQSNTHILEPDPLHMYAYERQWNCLKPVIILNQLNIIQHNIT